MEKKERAAKEGRSARVSLLYVREKEETSGGSASACAVGVCVNVAAGRSAPGITLPDRQSRQEGTGMFSSFFFQCCVPVYLCTPSGEKKEIGERFLFFSFSFSK